MAMLKLRRISRQVATYIQLTDAELEIGRELERIAKTKQLEADFAATDAENYYDQFMVTLPTASGELPTMKSVK